MVCKSYKPAVQLIFQMVRDNMWITTGRNVIYILDLFEYDNLMIDEKLKRRKLLFHQISDTKVWRITLIKEIMDIKQNTVSFSNEYTDANFLSSDELQDIIDSYQFQ